MVHMTIGAAFDGEAGSDIESDEEEDAADANCPDIKVCSIIHCQYTFWLNTCHVTLSRFYI